jgi:hypothetical protein
MNTKTIFSIGNIRRIGHVIKNWKDKFRNRKQIMQHLGKNREDIYAEALSNQGTVLELSNKIF